MESPCILVCSIEPTTGYCWGCGRTTGEIGGWSIYSDDQRTAIMAELPGRVASLPERKKRLTKRRARAARDA